ncbi:MAG: hypothetical protein DRH32_06660 [Deltaproteobacteria bacterium]|nr:MAG: hypothetical protein DRH32_06660 [Deltaproteobacteria bacterium]
MAMLPVRCLYLKFRLFMSENAGRQIAMTAIQNTGKIKTTNNSVPCGSKQPPLILFEILCFQFVISGLSGSGTKKSEP